MTELVTHDELDAITSALVGVFFWSGKFEALGESAEEALVIPDLHADAKNWRKKLVIGVSGPVAVGKTTVATYLTEKGFRYGRYSAVLKDLLASKSADRNHLQHYGKKVHDSKGQRWLGRELLKRLPSDANLVIDGLRFPDDHAFLVERFGPAFRHIHLTAPATIRKNRFNEREGKKASFSRAEAAPVEKEISTLRKLAHHVINADAREQTVHRRVSGSLPKTTKRK